jgi:hypothetical protein
MLETKGPTKSWSGKTELLPGKTEGDVTWGAQPAQFICPEFRDVVADGVVYLRASCQRAVCVKWKSGQCRMCSTTKEAQRDEPDLLEERS